MFLRRTDAEGQVRLLGHTFPADPQTYRAVDSRPLADNGRKTRRTVQEPRGATAIGNGEATADGDCWRKGRGMDWMAEGAGALAAMQSARRNGELSIWRQTGRLPSWDVSEPPAEAA